MKRTWMRGLSMEIKTWDELRKVCENLKKQGKRSSLKYFEDARRYTLLYCKGLDVAMDSILAVERLEKYLKKHGYALDKESLIEGYV